MENPNKTYFAVRFYVLVAKQIAARIMRLNGRRWPRSLNQWQEVAKKVRYVVLLVRDAPGVPTCCLFAERVILVQYTPCRRTLYRAIAHEMAHAMLADGGPSGNLLDWPREPEEDDISHNLSSSDV